MHYDPVLLLTIDLLAFEELLLLWICCDVVVATSSTNACLAILQVLGIVTRLELPVADSLHMAYILAV